MHEIIEREKAYYDKVWAGSQPREIHGVFDFPWVASTEGKKILICACGVTTAPILAARAGAQVFAFDISPIAVEQTRQLATLNGVKIEVEVMDFHHLGYPDDFFDLAYGTSILHHIDCNLAGRELRRVLKPGGVAAFWENSDRNPVVRWFRRKAFGVPGGFQKRKFLFLRRIGSTDEYPLTEEEIQILSTIFDGSVRCVFTQFVFFRLIAMFGWNNPAFHRFMRLLDDSVAKVFPSLLNYSYIQWVLFQKPAG